MVFVGCGGYSPNTPKAEIIQNINNYSESDQIKVVKNKSTWIQYINNPTEKVQLASVNFGRGRGKAIQYIDSPTSAVQLAAVKKNPSNISKINNPTEEVCIYSVSKNRALITYIKNPSDKVKKIANKDYKNQITILEDQKKMHYRKTIISSTKNHVKNNNKMKDYKLNYTPNGMNEDNAWRAGKYRTSLMGGYTFTHSEAIETCEEWFNSYDHSKAKYNYPHSISVKSSWITGCMSGLKIK